MRTLGTVLVCLSLSLPAFAEDGNFEAHYRSQPSGSIEIGRVDVSAELRAKADQLGEAELARLTGYLREVLETTLVEVNWHGIAARETVLEVTLVDVMPSRPTMAQIQEMGLGHYSSRGTGGAELTAELRDADGRMIGRYSYSWYNSEAAGPETGIWSDTRTAFARFARELADSLGDAPMPRSSAS